MIRRINYTGRKRLSKEDTRILLNEPEGEVATFDASLSLQKYELPNDASVFVEAYRQTAWMRFNFGVVGNITPPDDRRLSQFDSVEGILFRVKVTSTSSPQGKLLAESDCIHFQRPEEEPDERLPLLPVKPQELGDEIARIDFNDNSQPLMLINSSAGDYREIARSPVFIALVYPQAVREILSRILIIEEHSDIEDPDDWKSRWLRFAISLPGVSEPPATKDNDNDPLWDWIDGTVAAFARKNQMMNRFQEYWREEN